MVNTIRSFIRKTWILCLAGVAGIATVSLSARSLENVVKSWAIQNEVILEDTGEILSWLVQTEAGNQEEADQLLKKTCDALWEESGEDREMVNGIPRFFGGPECGGNLYKGSYEGYLLYSEGKYV